MHAHTQSHSAVLRQMPICSHTVAVAGGHHSASCKHRVDKKETFSLQRFFTFFFSSKVHLQQMVRANSHGTGLWKWSASCCFTTKVPSRTRTWAISSYPNNHRKLDKQPRDGQIHVTSVISELSCLSANENKDSSKVLSMGKSYSGAFFLCPIHTPPPHHHTTTLQLRLQYESKLFLFQGHVKMAEIRPDD